MNRTRSLVCALVLLGTTTNPAHAALQTFLLIPGVPGESPNPAHPNWIDVQSLTVGVTAGVCNGFVVTKLLDRASPLLSAAALTRLVYPSATFHTQRDGLGQVLFLTYALESVTVHSVSFSQTADSLTEVVTLRPVSVMTTYFPQHPDGSLGEPIETRIDCKYR